MATASKVFVSPGVYTSEVDLTYVAQSVGVTTLGLAGETMMGPAFEPILIQSWNNFQSTFGSTNPAKDGNGNPAYELPYVANSYLQESNQLFVTRILGLTGYKPNNTFAIKTLGGVTVDTTSEPSEDDFVFSASTLSHEQSSPIYSELSDKTAFNGQSITDYLLTHYSGNTSGNTGDWFTIGLVPSMDVNSQTGTEKVSPLTGNYTANNNNNKEWFNVFFHKTGATDNTIDAVYSYLFVYSDTFKTFLVTRYEYAASLNTDYHGVVALALRSRGHYGPSNELVLEVAGSGANQLVSASSSNNIETNPFVEFTLNVTGNTGGALSYPISLSNSISQYAPKVLGTAVFDKAYKNFPLYVYEIYDNLVNVGFQKV